MTSDLAISEIERMQKAGLKPTAEDIIRLNALGLKIEFSADAGDIYSLPRTARLGPLCFREPAIGHDMWLAEVFEYTDRAHLPTYLAVTAYALSRPVEALPDTAERKKVGKEVGAFVKKSLRPFTLLQIKAAVYFALYGPDETALEFPERPEDPEDPHMLCTGAPRAVAAGALVETVSLALGLSVGDIMHMTKAQAYRVRTLAMIRSGINLRKQRGDSATDDFYVTAAEIEKRLKAEKEKSDGR